MKKLLLPTTKKNEVLRMIKNRGLDPKDFEWTEIEVDRIPTVADAAKISVLVHRPTGYHFCFDVRKGVNTATYSPGGDVVEREERRGNMEAVVACVPNWLYRLKPEARAVDLWAQVAHVTPSFETAFVIADDRPFSADERDSARQVVAEMKQWLLDQQEIEEQHRASISARLDYLVAGVDRLPRRDWLFAILGVSFTIAFELGPKAKEFLRAGLEALGRLFPGVAGLLP